MNSSVWGDYNTTMHEGPLFFRHHVQVVEAYNALVNVENMVLDSIRVWTRMAGMHDLLRNELVAKAMTSKMD